MEKTDEKIARLYRHRFSENELIFKEKLWKILIREIIQKYIRDYDTVVDIGGGDCQFINNIRCGKKYVVDLNPDTKDFANNDVSAIHANADNISYLSDGSTDVVFVCNFFEHMKSKHDLERVIVEIRRILSPTGLLLIIQPNIRYAYKEYWDFYDHHIPISDSSLTELLNIYNFRIKTCYPRFLPYTTKSKLSRFSFLLKIYLRLPLLWHVFGKQLFIVAQKSQPHTAVI